MVKFKLVYFDDQEINIDSVEGLLNSDFQVIGCTKSYDCEEILNTHQPHAYLIDVIMPVVNGFDLYEKILNHPKYNGCPIFFISGDPSDEDRLRASNHGVVDFLNREILGEELILRLKNKIKIYLKGAKILDFANLRLNLASYKAFVDDYMVDITLSEMRLLSYTLRNFPELVSKEHLIENYWGSEIKTGTINTHLSNLGLKLWDWSYGLRVNKNGLLELFKKA